VATFLVEVRLAKVARMKKITEDVYLNPDCVVSVEYDATYKNVGSPSDSCMEKDFEGTRVTLNNGRKVFISGLTPAQVMEKLL